MLPPDKKQQADDALLESLLHEMYNADPNRDSERIASLMKVLDRDAVKLANGVDHSNALTDGHKVFADSRFPGSRRRWTGTWAALGLALSLIIAIGYGLFGMSSNQAYAAVDRCLSTQLSARHYRVTMKHQRPVWGTGQVTAHLYFDNRDRFAFQHPGLFRKGPLWIGGGPNERWLVPAFGPAFTGRSEFVSQWMSNRDMPAPFLHVMSVLQRLRRTYKLQLVGDETIDSGDRQREVLCRHVVGTLRNPQPNLPAHIDLWADVDSGIAERIELKWNRPAGERGPTQWVIDYMGEPNLPVDWFQVEGHVDPSRHIVRLETQEQLEAAME